MKVKFTTFEEIKLFIRYTSSLDSRVTIYSGKYVVDGKSIMGILSLDLENTLIVVVDEVADEERLAHKLNEIGILV